MAQEIFQTNALPDEFAARIGKLVQVQGPVVEARFDPAALPELLSELTITDDARRIDVTVEVAQRLKDGVVRCVARSPICDLKPGARVVPTGKPAHSPIAHDRLEAFVRGAVGARAGRTAGDGNQGHRPALPDREGRRCRHLRRYAGGQVRPH